MSSYIDHRPACGTQPRWPEDEHSWARDLSQRLYGDPHTRMTSVETQEDLMRWRRLGNHAPRS